MSEGEETVQQEESPDSDVLLKLIVGEWPVVEMDELEDVADDREAIVAIVAEKTDHTKTLVSRQLAELEEIAAKEKKNWHTKEYQKLKEKVSVLQNKLTELAGYTRSQISEGFTETKTKADEHPLVVLLMALGVGLIFGFFMRGFGGRDRR